MASEQPGYFLFLSLILARCVRGQYGAPFVIKYTVTYWATFTRDFGAFCNGLVAAAEIYSKEMGKTYLAHREGLMAAFSGLQFLRTLRRKACRDKLEALAKEFMPLFTRLLQHKGRTRLSDAEFTSLGNAMMGRICLAIHSNVERFMRNYHSMDATRCFQACLQYGLGLKEFTYTKLVHDWVLKKQAKKFRDKVVKNMYFYGLKSPADVAKEIDKLSANVSGTFIFSTFFAHLCEVRQCINRFGVGGTAYLVHLYHTAPVCKQSADDVMVAMKNGTWRKTGCFAVMVLDAVRLAGNLSLEKVKQSALRGAHPWVVVRRMSVLSPKLCVEGIPEWVALRNNLDLLISKCSGSYSDLCKAAKRLSLRVNTATGRRYTKTELRKAIDASLQASQTHPILTKKRKWAELKDAVHAAGGNVRYRIAGKRLTMTKEEMSVWLSKQLPS